MDTHPVHLVPPVFDTKVCTSYEVLIWIWLASLINVKALPANIKQHVPVLQTFPRMMVLNGFHGVGKSYFVDSIATLMSFADVLVNRAHDIHDAKQLSDCLNSVSRWCTLRKQSRESTDYPSDQQCKVLVMEDLDAWEAEATSELSKKFWIGLRQIYYQHALTMNNPPLLILCTTSCSTDDFKRGQVPSLYYAMRTMGGQLSEQKLTLPRGVIQSGHSTKEPSSQQSHTNETIASMVERGNTWLKSQSVVSKRGKSTPLFHVPWCNMTLPTITQLEKMFSVQTCDHVDQTTSTSATRHITKDHIKDAYTECRGNLHLFRGVLTLVVHRVTSPAAESSAKIHLNDYSSSANTLNLVRTAVVQPVFSNGRDLALSRGGQLHPEWEAVVRHLDTLSMYERQWFWMQVYHANFNHLRSLPHRHEQEVGMCWMRTTTAYSDADVLDRMYHWSAHADSDVSPDEGTSFFEPDFVRASVPSKWYETIRATVPSYVRPSWTLSTAATVRKQLNRMTQWLDMYRKNVCPHSSWRSTRQMAMEWISLPASTPAPTASESKTIAVVPSTDASSTTIPTTTVPKKGAVKRKRKNTNNTDEHAWFWNGLVDSHRRIRARDDQQHEQPDDVSQIKLKHHWMTSIGYGN